MMLASIAKNPFTSLGAMTIWPSAASAVLLTACVTALPSFAGETRKFEDLDFDEVVVLGSVKVEIKQGEPQVLLVNGPDDVLDKKPFYVKDDTLVLGKSKTYSGRDNEYVKFKIIMPELRELRVKGSGAAYVKEFELRESRFGGPPMISVEGSGDIKLYGIDGPAVELRIKGSGDIKVVDINVGELEAVVSGSGDLFIQNVEAKDAEFVVTGSGDLGVTEGGYVHTMEVSVIGSGDAHLKDVDCEQVEVNIVGSGSADLGEVREQLNASVLGSGDVRYRGTPNVDKVEFGSGEVRRRD